MNPTQTELAEDPASALRAATGTPDDSREKKNDPYRVIGRGLKRMFEDVVNEPVPDDLMALVKKLEQTDDGSEDVS